MAITDVQLGAKIRDVLLARGIETPIIKSIPTKSDEQRAKSIFHSFGDIMSALRLDLSDDSLSDTPLRVSKMYAEEIFYGLDYSNFPACFTVENKMAYDEVIASAGIDVLSCCEHHFVPFIGHAYVAYIPENKILGLSKFNRVVDFFSRRPQVQERLTEQCHAAFRTILETDDVAVVIRAQHLCVRLRGVEQANSSTITSKLSGRFKEVPALRSEFFALMGG